MKIIDIYLLCFIFLLIVLFYYYLNNNKLQKNINYDNVYVLNNNDITKIYNEDDVFYKKHFIKNMNDTEIKQININKGKLTRQSITHETGGSHSYKNLKINSNISDNKIKPQEIYKSYSKLPFSIK